MDEANGQNPVKQGLRHLPMRFVHLSTCMNIPDAFILMLNALCDFVRDVSSDLRPYSATAWPHHQSCTTAPARTAGPSVMLSRHQGQMISWCMLADMCSSHGTTVTCTSQWFLFWQQRTDEQAVHAHSTTPPTQTYPAEKTQTNRTGHEGGRGVRNTMAQR